jgi:two-component system, NtrC family, response regulator HydG
MLSVFIVDHEPSIVALVYAILEDDWVRSSRRRTSTPGSRRRFPGASIGARYQVEYLRGCPTGGGPHQTRPVFDGSPLELRSAGEAALETFKGVREPDGPYQVVPLPSQPHEGGRTTAVASGAGQVPGRPAERLLASRRRPDARLRRGWERAAVRRALRRAGVPDFVGEGPGIQAILAKVLQIAPSDARVVILGESGTGKGLLARTIHALSCRRAKPFVDVHCGAVATALLESELFGHERGAFTGAIADKPGLLELANGGTLFLDEFAEMTPEMQTKLLKVLDHGELRRVGGVRTMTVDVRLLVATNRNLDELVRTGRVRMDLLHRIDVVRITLPPLRHRPEDVPRFVAHFIALHRRRGLGAKTITPQALRVLQAYPWPGNVRELANTIERLMLLAPGPTIDVDDLPEGLHAGPTELLVPVDELGLTLEEVQRRHILRVLDAVNGNRAAAARRLGLERNTLKRKLKRWEGATRSKPST